MMPKRYSMILILFLLTMLFGPLMPGISIICAIGLFLMEAVMRWILLWRATFQIQVGEELAIYLAQALPFASILYAIMNMLFYWQVWGEYSVVHIVALCITVISLFLPIRRIIDKCFVPEVEKDEKETYQNNYRKFKHYDYLNPITRFAAI